MTSVQALHEGRKNHIEHSQFPNESLKGKDVYKLTILGKPITLLLYQFESRNVLFRIFFPTDIFDD